MSSASPSLSAIFTILVVILWAISLLASLLVRPKEPGRLRRADLLLMVLSTLMIVFLGILYVTMQARGAT